MTFGSVKWCNMEVHLLTLFDPIFDLLPCKPMQFLFNYDFTGPALGAPAR